MDETHDVEAHYLSDSENLERSYSHDSSFPSYDRPVSDDDSDLPQESRIEVVEMSQGIKDAAIRQDFRRTYDPIPYGSTLGLASVESVPYPLTENHEVRLMQYYITYMCTWVCHLDYNQLSTLSYLSSTSAILVVISRTLCRLEQPLVQPFSTPYLLCHPAI